MRKESKVLWDKWGKNRYLFESLFGTIKLKMGSHFRVKDKEIAQKMGLAVFLLYNMYMLARFIYVLLLIENYLLIFRTPLLLLHIHN
ncbi:hypothetical protein [Thermosulfidibacter takaii]|uniref:hypothetical protein n=1 Tax=Thermosulfidibacter takaii TaxID=412593 RepID=UPI0008399967|nr:hypothetical protein [Thermosulfidibacter takaii]